MISNKKIKGESESTIDHYSKNTKSAILDWGISMTFVEKKKIRLEKRKYSREIRREGKKERWWWSAGDFLVDIMFELGEYIIIGFVHLIRMIVAFLHHAH